MLGMNVENQINRILLYSWLPTEKQERMIKLWRFGKKKKKKTKILRNLANFGLVRNQYFSAPNLAKVYPKNKNAA
jgi:hypothetical protein